MLKVVATKCGNGPKIRAAIGCQPAKGHVVDNGLSDFAAGRDPNAVRVEQDFEHHGRMKGRPALAVIPKPPEQRFEIKRTDHTGDEAHQMLLREPVIQVGSKQKPPVRIVVAEVVPHDAGHLVYSNEFIDYITKYRLTSKPLV